MSSGVVFNGAVICLGIAGFLISAVLTLCRVFWKTSVVPTVTNCSQPKAACEVLARSIEHIHATAVETILASPPQSLLSLEDDSTIASSTGSTSSEGGSSRSATLDDHLDERKRMGRSSLPSQATDPLNQIPKSPTPCSQPTSLPQKESYPFLQDVPPRTTSRAPKRSKSLRCLKRARSLGARHRESDMPPSDSSPPAHSTGLPSTPDTHRDTFILPLSKGSLDSSDALEPLLSPASDRSPPRGLRKYLSLHWNDRHHPQGGPPHPPAPSSSLQDSAAKPVQKKQSKTLRKTRSELRHDGVSASGVTAELPSLPPRRHSDKEITPLQASPPNAPPSRGIFSKEETVVMPPQSFSPPPRVDSQLPSLGKSNNKKKQPAARTDPYAAPYFFPAPGSAEAAEYTTVKRPRTTRSATLPPTNATVVHLEKEARKRDGAQVPAVPPLPPTPR
jgi:hypothetical protein